MVKKLDVVRQRKVAAVVGAAVADAAARPLHWVYDNNALQSYIRDVADTPEFFPENKSPFYSLPTGENSCYWDIAEASLTALATGGGYSYARVVEELVKSFGAGNGRYDLEARQEYMAKRREGKVDGPITGKWFHGAVIHFLKTYNNGIGSKPFGDPHEKATDGFCLAVPLVAGYAGTEQLGKVTREAIETMVTWPTAVQHGQVAARILEEMILRGEEYEVMSVVAEIAGKFPEVVRSVQAVEQVLDMEHTRAVNYVFGSPCYNPGYQRYTLFLPSSYHPLYHPLTIPHTHIIPHPLIPTPLLIPAHPSSPIPSPYHPPYSYHLPSSNTHTTPHSFPSLIPSSHPITNPSSHPIPFPNPSPFISPHPPTFVYYKANDTLI